MTTKKCNFAQEFLSKIKNVTKKHHIQNYSACHSDSHAYSIHRSDVRHLRQFLNAYTLLYARSSTPPMIRMMICCITQKMQYDLIVNASW